MKLINGTSCVISAYVINDIFHLNISHKERCWLGGTQYRGDGLLHDEGEHFSMYDDYNPTGEKEIDELDHSKYKEFCIVPENDEEKKWTNGIWYRAQNKEDETFVCIPIHETLIDIPLTIPYYYLQFSKSVLY